MLIERGLLSETYRLFGFENSAVSIFYFCELKVYLKSSND